MGRSSLLGAEPAELQPGGRDIAALGPGDSSDSGSDVAGLEGWSDAADPTEPVDVALRGNRQRSALPPDALAGGSSDAAGTGERRSAGGDAGRREAVDISVDRVFDLDDLPAQDAADDLVEVDQAGAPDTEGEEEDESADPVGDGHSDAEAARKLPDRPSGRGSGRKQ